MNIMIDLETLGTKPNSAILSIGAVAFDKNGIHDEFYVNVDLKSSLEMGFDIDPDTVYWWLKQDKEAGMILEKDRVRLSLAIKKLDNFIYYKEAESVWANSPSFDLVMLKNAFEKLNISCGWEFYNERDFRTFLNITGVKRVYPEIAHNALDDAKAQAQTVVNWMNKA